MSNIVNAFSEGADTLITFVKALPQTVQETVAAGLIVAFVVGTLAFFRNTIRMLFRKLFVRGEGSLSVSQPGQVPSNQEVKITVEAVETPRLSSQPQTPSILSSPLHEQASLPSKPSVFSQPLEVDFSPIPLILPRSPDVGFVPRQDRDGYDFVKRLKEELAPKRNRLITLWGPGGVGKTTLAAEAARELAEIFTHQIIWTSAEGRADFTFSTLLDEIATQLGHVELRKLSMESKEEEVRLLIAPEARLIILDDFETIAPEEQKLCSDWIIRHTQCSALITTRERISNARNISINAMYLDEVHEFIDRLINQTQNLDAFHGLDRNRIIDVAGRNPLVLQWVIAQVELVQDPQTVLNELGQGYGDATRRIFDRSFNLPQLGHDGRATLLALSLFVPSASRSGLAKVAGFQGNEDRVNEAVKGLAALCLVKTTDSGLRLTVEGLTRELASTRLSENKRADEFYQMFVSNFLDYAKAHAQPTPEDFDAVEKEKDNLLSAIDIAFELKDWDSVRLVMEAIFEALNARGYWYEAIRRGELALEAMRNVRIKAARARFARNVAMMYRKRGDWLKARQLYLESLESDKRLGNQSGIANALH